MYVCGPFFGIKPWLLTFVDRPSPKLAFRSSHGGAHAVGRLGTTRQMASQMAPEYNII